MAVLHSLGSGRRGHLRRGGRRGGLPGAGPGRRPHPPPPTARTAVVAGRDRRRPARARPRGGARPPPAGRGRRGRERPGPRGWRSVTPPARPRRASAVAAASERGRLGAMAPATPTIEPTDLDHGSFSDTPPWTLDDPTALAWRQGLADVRARVVAEVPAPHHARPLAARPPRSSPSPDRLGAAVAPVGAAREAPRRRRSAAPASPAASASRPSGSARPTSSSGRSSRSGEGIFPAELVDEFKLLPRPGARRAVPGRARGHRGRPRATARRGVPLGRPHAAGRGLDRPGPRGHAAHRRAGGGQGPAADGRPAGARRPAGHGVAGPEAGRAHPDRRAGQPAGAGRAVRPDDHRGARLPARGREHARRRPHVRRARASGATSSPAPTPRSSRPGSW